jgi:HPr kinase/phosphorylase
MENYYVSLEDIIKKMRLKNLTPEVATEDIKVFQTDINRPGLQLAGFFDYFDAERVQVIGKVEYTYLESLTVEKRRDILKRFFSYKMPCLVLSRDQDPMEEIIEFAVEKEIPVLQTRLATSYFNSELNRYLKVELAPRISMHGVLVDVFGEGVFITGESGIGKSEAALELIKRGHRLVADDAVDIKKVSDETLLGSSPLFIRHFIEVRGIGIVDCKMLFGVESVKDVHSIDLCIQLEDWDPHKEYERLGMEDNYIEILGNKVVSHVLPVRPGRNLAIILESAALNHRQKKMGYNAAAELNARVLENLEKLTETNTAQIAENLIDAAKEEESPSITPAQINYRPEE